MQMLPKLTVQEVLSFSQLSLCNFPITDVQAKKTAFTPAWKPKQEEGLIELTSSYTTCCLIILLARWHYHTKAFLG